MRIPVAFLLFLLTTSAVRAQVSGNWYAILEAGGRQIPLDLEITETPEGYTGGLLSPAQSDVRIPLSSVVVNADSILFEVSNFAIRFAGMQSEEKLTGTFWQGAFSAPLTWTRDRPAAYTSLLTPEEAIPRPQEPTEFPYQREAVSFPGGAPGVTLAGELTLPTSATPKAAVVLVSGSGPQDRNEYLGPSINHRPFLVLSDRLTRNGYAVLRYDDRGVGESSGDFAAATSLDFAGDATAALRFLHERFTEDELAIGLVGHSEGGMIAQIVAAEPEQADFIILLAAPGLPIDELMADQRRLLGSVMPSTEPVMAAATSYIKAHPDMDEGAFRRGLRDTIVSVIPALPAPARESIVDAETFAETFANELTSPWMRYFLAHDPLPYLRRISVPVLAVNGEKDTQVSPRNLQGIERALAEAENPDVTAKQLPGLNHLLQPATSGLPAEYGTIATTIDEAALRVVTEWLNQRFD
ncbi:hypothetical protein CLV84_1521 [Neolewinella xylanilytica]|uniref:Serine aminopeptidase S33 domain-containing protein n=1 Tax=Neolewinella xylanilytica TaxID=1514080 RepID=A0A2S6IAM5_9BACT|nr:alpha/beta fold hydrolase [Neolewinella xylanilytica]PPK88553.1 hypothetical protein CLV84_1521 [Neolewinella xylanilytica]